MWNFPQANATKYFNDKPILAPVMDWYRQAASHYLNQWWLRYQWSHGVMRSQWVKYIMTHQMEAFSALLALCVGIHRSPVNSLHKGQWCTALMFSLICARANGWANNRDSGNLRRHRVHYYVTVMAWMHAMPLLGTVSFRICRFDP